MWRGVYGHRMFEGAISLQEKLDIKPYQVWHKLFKEKLEKLLKQDILELLGMDEMVEW